MRILCRECEQIVKSVTRNKVLLNMMKIEVGVNMISVLGKLICRELGRDKYRDYIKCLKNQQSAPVFLDLYLELEKKNETDKARMLVRLLDTVQLSIRISRRFSFTVLFYFLVMAALVFLLSFNIIFFTAALLCTGCILYKLIEFIINRYCDKDIRMILIYKSVLFHLLEHDSV